MYYNFIGDNTFIGRIAGLASGLNVNQTTMARELNHFVKLICAVAVFFGVIFFIVALTMGYALIDAIMFLIGVRNNYFYLIFSLLLVVKKLLL